MRSKLMMLKSEITATKRHIKHKRSKLIICAFCASLWLILICGGCRRDMQDQPKMKPYRSTTFFTDGLSSRQPIEGTVARGQLRSDTEFFTGKKAKAPGATPAATPATQQTAGTQSTITANNNFPDDVDTFPFPVTKEVVMRGHERYNIFCSVCHGLTGNGDGMIVRRGFRRA